MQELDTESVISEISKWPCLWDNTVRDFRIRKCKQKAWEEVTKAVVDNYQHLSDEDQFKMIEKVQQRWRNVRVCYIKERANIKKKATGNGKARRSYVFYDQLRFMDKIVSSEDKFAHLDPNDNDELSNTVSPKIVKVESDADMNYMSDLAESDGEMKRRDDTEEEDNSVRQMVADTWEKINDSDFSFFNSILPMVQELNNDNKLLFRSKVIQELVMLRNRRKVTKTQIRRSFSEEELEFSDSVIKSE